jgi:hypothetical protein
MAVVTISRIQQRRGLLEDLTGVNLAAGELGWAMDQRRLFIGNGEVSEGAPRPGNTEVMTEHSPLLDRLKYRYLNRRFNPSTGKLEPTVTAGWQVPRLLQERLDDRVSVQSYGVRGDGGETAALIAEETLNFRRAVYDLFGRDSSKRFAASDPENPNANFLTAKALYVPAGVYIINQPIPLLHKTVLVGDGAGRTVIILDDLANWTNLPGSRKSFVVGTAQFTGTTTGPDETLPMEFDFDSNPVTGRNDDLGRVEDITVSGITFINRNAEGHIVRLRNCENVTLEGCELDSQSGYRCDDDPYQAGMKTASDSRLRMAAVKIEGPPRTAVTTEKPPHRIHIDGCRLAGRLFGVSSVADVTQVAIRNSHIENVYDAINLGESESRWGVPADRAPGAPLSTIYGPKNVTAVNCYFSNVARYGFAVFTSAGGNGTIGCHHQTVGRRLTADCDVATGSLCATALYECIFFYNDGFAGGAVGNYVIGDSFFRDDLTAVNCGGFAWYDPVTNPRRNDRPRLPRVYNDTDRNLVVVPGIPLIQNTDFYTGSVHIFPVNSFGLLLPAGTSGDIPDGRSDAGVVEFDATIHDTMFVEYSLRQGANRRMGVIKLTVDPASASPIQFDDDYHEPYGAVAVAFNFRIVGSGTAARLRMTYSNTGADATARISSRLWKA